MVLSKDEIKIRQYLCSVCRFPKCDGILTVTNQRVIFHGLGASLFGLPCRVVDEVPLDAVSGFSSFYGRKWRWWVLLLAVLFLIGSLASFVAALQVSSPQEPVAAGAGGLIVAAILFLLATRKLFFLRIYSSKASATPIELGEGFNRFGSPAAVFALSAYPTAETDQMMIELGAMIGDLQKLREHAYDRWRR